MELLALREGETVTGADRHREAAAAAVALVAGASLDEPALVMAALAQLVAAAAAPRGSAPAAAPADTLAWPAPPRPWWAVWGRRP